MAGKVDLTLGVEKKSTWTWSATEIVVMQDISTHVF